MDMLRRYLYHPAVDRMQIAIISAIAFSITGLAATHHPLAAHQVFVAGGTYIVFCCAAFKFVPNRATPQNGRA